MSRLDAAVTLTYRRNGDACLGGVPVGSVTKTGDDQWVAVSFKTGKKVYSYLRVYARWALLEMVKNGE